MSCVPYLQLSNHVGLNSHNDQPDPLWCKGCPVRLKKAHCSQTIRNLLSFSLKHNYFQIQTNEKNTT